jgi:hypothetical protein
MAVPRRRFLGLLIAPAVGVTVDAARPAVAEGIERQTGESAPRAAVDPQTQRLRAIAIDDAIEPVLICVPGLE